MSTTRSKRTIKISNAPKNDSVLVHVDNFYSISNQTQRKTSINTLEEWLEKFVGINPRAEHFKQLNLIWLDVKVPLDR